MLAQDDGDAANLYLNPAHYHFEILRENSSEPVPTGQVGRIVLTDLHNYAMPLIRYDTGDLGSIHLVEDKNGVIRAALHQLRGRRTDVIYNDRGEPISPHAITNMARFHASGQFQIVQRGHGQYVFKAVADGPGPPGVLDAKLRQILGDRAELRYEFVEHIPPLPSGKRSYIANEMA